MAMFPALLTCDARLWSDEDYAVAGDFIRSWGRFARSRREGFNRAFIHDLVPEFVREFVRYLDRGPYFDLHLGTGSLITSDRYSDLFGLLYMTWIMVFGDTGIRMLFVILK